MLLLEAATGEIIGSESTLGGTVGTVLFTRDGKELICATHDGIVCFCEKNTLRTLRTSAGHVRPIRAQLSLPMASVWQPLGPITPSRSGTQIMPQRSMSSDNSIRGAT